LFLVFHTQFGHSFSVCWSWRQKLFDRHLAALLRGLPRLFYAERTPHVRQRSPTIRGTLEAIDKNEEFITMTLAVMMAPD